jgi:propionyl-CoA synthetase
MIIKIFNEGGSASQSTRICGGKTPLPPGTLLNLWKDNTRFRTGYLEQFPLLFSGDGGKDEDDYIYITGRVDDVINVAGHRLQRRKK